MRSSSGWSKTWRAVISGDAEAHQEARNAGLSLARIARELNEDGLYTRSGRPWRFEYVRSVLRRCG
jgi:hypothetical protein